MITLNDANKLWYKSKPIGGVSFFLNDSVRVTDGEHTNRAGSVISLLSLGPVTYLVELDDGSDVVISQSMLENFE